MRNLILVLVLFLSYSTYSQESSERKYGLGFNVTVIQMPAGLSFYTQKEDIGFFADVSISKFLGDINSDSGFFNSKNRLYQLTFNIKNTILENEKIKLSPYIGSGIVFYDKSHTINTSFGILLESNGTIYGIGYNSNPSGISLRLGFYL